MSGIIDAAATGWGRRASVLVLASALLAGQARAAGPEFPLQVAPSGRYLVDQRGEPFFVNGDTAWSLTHNLTWDEAVRYMEDRRARGVNALVVSVPDAYGPDKVADHPPDRQGQQPFLEGDIVRPNEAYWSHVDRVLAKSEKMGFLVLLWPFYLGCCDDGYMEMFQRGGVEKARAYGRFVGRRYGAASNLLWVHGGDHDPNPARDLVTAVKAGIMEAGPRRLHATHWAPETDPYAPFGEAFTDLYTTYTYEPVAALVSRHYEHRPVKPVLLLETNYENDFAGKTWEEVRAYPYQAVLSGAAGHVFGNKPLWYSGHGWEEALDSPGSRAMELVVRLFRSRPWWRLVPDSRLVTSGGGDPHRAEGVQAARADDGSFAMAFIPDSRTIVVDLGRLSGETVRACWFDVATGRVTRGDGRPARGSLALTPPLGRPAVLVLDVVERGFPPPGGPPIEWDGRDRRGSRGRTRRGRPAG